MPRRRFSRRTRRRNKKRSLKMISGNPFPNRIVRKLKTTQYYDLGTSSAGGIRNTKLALNSIYDPESAYGTQQPLGYDQYASLYNRYCVIGARLKVTYHNKDDESWVVGQHIAIDNTSLTSYEHYKEIKSTKSVLLSPDIDKVGMVSNVSPKKFFHIKNPLAFDDTDTNNGLNAPFGSNPANIVYAHIFAQPANQSSTTGDSVEVVVDLEQIVVFYDYIKPTRSEV